MTNLEKYMKTIAYKRLMNKYPSHPHGIWQIYGEDDSYGTSIIPRENLGVYEGYLIDVIDHVVELKGFLKWGAGGDIIKIEPTIISKTKGEHNE